MLPASSPRQRSLPLVATAVAPSSVTGKVALLRGLFRGREDVFPKLWIHRKARTKGYSPVCANEWRPGVCEKPRVRCGACPQQAFVPVEGRVVIAHLRGQHVMGVYPLLTDETCWFLAADFDKHSWADDIAAFRETCEHLGVPVAVERSRSGNGAHAWFFFDAPVAATTARKMGCFLLTETMARRHHVALGSYDRLFPNQDTMPRGGFGNLIALPLQHAARAAGNTDFLDERLSPHADQWAFLAAVERVTPSRADELAAEALRSRRVLGADFDVTDEETNTAPWTRPPSGRTPRPRLLAPLPPTIHVVLAQRLYVAIDGLPSAFVHRIKRLATFHSPEFYKRQTMRLSTGGTPRVIGCFEEHPHHLLASAWVPGRARGSRPGARLDPWGRGSPRRRRCARRPVPWAALVRTTGGGERVDRPRHRDLRGAARQREDRRRRVSHRRPRSQRAGARSSQTLEGPMGRAARPLPRPRPGDDWHPRRRARPAQRGPRRRDDPEPGAWRRGRRPHRAVRSRADRRVSSRSGLRVRAGGERDARPLRRRVERDAVPPRRAPPDPVHAVRSGAPRDRPQERGGAAAVRAAAAREGDGVSRRWRRRGGEHPGGVRRADRGSGAQRSHRGGCHLRARGGAIAGGTHGATRAPRSAGFEAAGVRAAHDRAPRWAWREGAA